MLEMLLKCCWARISVGAMMQALETIVHGDQHGHKCHQGFPAAHITLQQAVHLTARAHIPPDLLHYFFLGTGQFKGKVIPVKGIEGFSHRLEYISPEPLVSIGLSLQDVQLDVEELFEFKSQFGLFVLSSVVGKMDLPHGGIQVHQVQCLEQPGRKGLFKPGGQTLDQVGHQFADGLGSKVVILQFFGGGVDCLQVGADSMFLIRILQFGVNQVEFPVDIPRVCRIPPALFPPDSFQGSIWLP